MRMWGARLGDHSAGTARQGAGDAAEVHFHPSSPPRPARSLPLPQTALQPPRPFVPTHPPPDFPRPAGSSAGSAETGSLQGPMLAVSPSTACGSFQS